MTFKHVRGVSLRRSLACVAGASVLALTLAQGAVAQDSDDEGDVVIATGIRQALENALEEKRNAVNLTEVILAEDIGKLPDQNLAEVLENVTGIQITRQAGVGTGVQIRGADENRIEINGVTTVGSGTGRNGINFEDVSASIISGVEVIKAPDSSTIEGAVGGTINLRTIRPLDLDEDDVLASVRFQLEDANLSTDGLQPRVDGTLGKKWSNASGQEIAVVLSGSYAEQDSTSFLTRSETNGDDIIDANRNAIANGLTPEFATDFLNPQFFIQDLDNFEAENFNFVGSVEAAPTQNLKLFFDAIVNTQERRQESSRIQFSGIANLDAARAIANDPNSQFETVDFGPSVGGDIGTLERAVVGTLLIQPDETDGNLRFSSDTGSRVTDSTIIRLGGEWDVTEDLTARAEFSNSRSESESPSFNTTLNFINPNIGLNLDQLQANALAGITGSQSANESGTTFLFDLSDDQLSFGVSDDVTIGGATSAQLLDPANILLRDVQQNFDETENEESAFRLDFNYDLTDSGIGSFLSSIDAGYRNNETSSTLADIGTSIGLRSAADSVSGAFFADILVPGPDNFDTGSDRSLFVPDFLLIDQELSNSDPEAVLARLNQAIIDSNAATGLNAGLLNSPTVNQVGSFTIEEETDAIYGQANFDFGVVRGNAGLRYIDTTVTSIGTTLLNGVASQSSEESSYDFVLPRVNLIVEPIENVLIRGSWSEDIRRPDFNDLNTSVSFSTSPNPNVSIGNVNLAPQEVENFEVGAEWYFAPGAVFSVGYFRKERDGVFVELAEQAEDTFVQVTDADGNILGQGDVRDITDPCEGGGIFNPIADQNEFAPLDPVTGSRTSGTGVCVGLNQVVNDTGTTDQQGVEVAFQYDLSSWEDRLGWASGFGIIANYTYQEFSGTEALRTAGGSAADIFRAASGGLDPVQFEIPLENNSEHSYNLTAFYEKFGLSARARWTWRDSFALTDGLTSLGNTLGTNPIQDSRGQLNASINYDVTENFNIGVEGVNITSEDILQRCVSDSGPVCFAEETERRIIFGGRYTF